MLYYGRGRSQYDIVYILEEKAVVIVWCSMLVPAIPEMAVLSSSRLL
jgi:hypothetical protein